ncbi:hypothetical protein BDR07DRAFT_1372437 [Suillus spraguei]|nr:hypothetical protein BDR07DRAFT_1372437 [Suillus spraguei]
MPLTLIYELSTFKIEYGYSELVSSTITHRNIQIKCIKEVVTTYFQNVMLSHRWEGKEPLLQDIQGKIVDDLDPVGGITKLQSFCKTACDLGYCWAWSDTCCIDKSNNVELQESVNSMFVWYCYSALTIVYLHNVPPSSQPGALARSVWNKQGWTFQEFVAPKVVIFYQKDWSLYLDDQSFNHKESFAIMKELEDIAYSLFGIFSVHLPVIYGKKKQNTLGQLLQEIVARSGDITVLDWIGQPSEFNSCLPAYITSYTTPPCTFPSLSEDEIQTFLALLLHLPCITFRVTDISLSYGPSQQTHSMYEIKADGLHNLLITTKEPISRTRLTRQTFVLVRPWDGSLIELPDFGDFPSGDDAESEGDYWTPPSSPSDDSPGRSFLKQEVIDLEFVFMLERQHGGEYKRVASDHDIIAQVVKGMTSVPDLMDIKTIEILRLRSPYDIALDRLSLQAQLD